MMAPRTLSIVFLLSVVATTIAADGAAPQRKRVRLMIECDDEDECLKDINSPANTASSPHLFKGTKFFALEADSEEEIKAWKHVQKVLPDPPRWSAMERDLQAVVVLEERLTYGLDIMNVIPVQEKFGVTGKGVKMCVIDSGVIPNHEDLDYSKMMGCDDRDVECRETITPWNNDAMNHGTHVTGIIAAKKGNGKGVIGVAPDVELFIVRVFDDNNQFYSSDVLNAMRVCNDAGADIINLSLGGNVLNPREETYCQELADKGIILVGAAGNGGNKDNLPFYPASHPSVISVAAVDHNREIADFSTHNPMVDVSAPGVRIVSIGINGPSDYASSSGTSMACPHVSGVAALMKQLKPSATPKQIMDALTVSAEKRGWWPSERDDKFGYGVVDAAAAVEALLGKRYMGPTVQVELYIDFDNYAEENTYEIKGSDGKVVAFANNLRNGQEYTRRYLKLKPDCYTFHITDSGNDGIDGMYGNGSYQIKYDGEKQVAGTFTNDKASETFGECSGANSGGAGSTPSTPKPSLRPTKRPTRSPTRSPTKRPTKSPTRSPTKRPTRAPTPRPTKAPIKKSGSSNIASDTVPDSAANEVRIDVDVSQKSQNAETPCGSDKVQLAMRYDHGFGSVTLHDKDRGLSLWKTTSALLPQATNMVRQGCFRRNSCFELEIQKEDAGRIQVWLDGTSIVNLSASETDSHRIVFGVGCSLQLNRRSLRSE